MAHARKSHFVLIASLLALLMFALLLLLGSVWMFVEIGRKPIEQVASPEEIEAREREQQRKVMEKEALRAQREREREERILASIPLAQIPWDRALSAVRPSRLADARTPWDATESVLAATVRPAKMPWSEPPSISARVNDATVPWPDFATPLPLTEFTTVRAAKTPFIDTDHVNIAAAEIAPARSPWPERSLALTSVTDARTPWPPVGAPAAAVTTAQLPWDQRSAPTAVDIAAAGLPWPATEATAWRPLSRKADVIAAEVPWIDPDAIMRRPTAFTGGSVKEAKVPWTDETAATTPKRSKN